MSQTPPYASDTLRWAAVEVKFPPLEDLATGVPSAVRDRVAGQFPVLETATQVSLAFGPAAPAAQQAVLHRFLQRDRLMSLTFSRDTVVLETTEYPGWTSFRDLFVSGLLALQEVMHPAGIVRVGLRYIDEVRLPDPPSEVQGWQTWIDDRLVAPFLLGDGSRMPNGGTVVLQFGTAPGFVTVFRAAPLASGRAVQEDGPLRTPYRTPDAAYFLLDTDASWADPDRQVPEFVVDDIRRILDDLHTPCHTLYESAITDKLRHEVLTQARAAFQP